MSDTFKSTIASQNFDKALQGGLDYAADKSGIRADIVASAEMSNNVAQFKNAAGVVLFTLDLSSLGGEPVYGNLVLSTDALTIAEGASGTFTVKLESAPSVNQVVYLALSGNEKLSVSPATLTFTPSNWDTAQTVTLTAAQDEDMDNEEITVALTSKNVDGKQLLVTISDDDLPALVTNGLVLNMDYSGHVDDTSDTIVDLASGVSFKNFAQFTKVEGGIYGPGNCKYLAVVSDDAKTAFLSKLKETGGFTVESFGTCFAKAFYAPNYNAVLDPGNANGWNIADWRRTTPKTNATRILQDGTTDKTALGADGWTFTINGVTKPINNLALAGLFPYDSDFAHIVFTFSSTGDVNFFFNGQKCDAPVTAENFQAWDFDTMFGGDWSLLNNWNTGDGTYTAAHRIYNRVLTDEEVTKNMEYNASRLGLSTF